MTYGTPKRARARVALAWLLQKPAVTAPIVGATKPYHLEDAVGACRSNCQTRRSRRWRSLTFPFLGRV